MDQQNLFTLLQMSDSAFPTGGYSHSLGLEAYAQFSGARGQMDPEELLHALVCVIENTASLSLPFVKASHEAVTTHREQDVTMPWTDGNVIEVQGQSAAVTRLVELDQMYQAYMSNHVAAKASIRQGKSLLEACISTYPHMAGQALLSQLVGELPYCHQCVVHGTVMAALGLDAPTTVTAFMFGVVRTLVASAVRLDLVGAMEGQRLQTKLQYIAEAAQVRNAESSLEMACIKFPLVDILQNKQDSLFAKLFYS